MHYQRRPVIQHLSFGVVFLMLDNLDVHVVGVLLGETLLQVVKGASPYNVISTPLHHERHSLVDALWTLDTSIFDEPIVRKELQNITVVHHKYPSYQSTS